MDFIWTWARDVYRPQVLSCLRAAVPRLHDILPTTSYSASRSQSVLSVSGTGMAPNTLPDLVREENVAATPLRIHERKTLLDASSHPFLRWADRQKDSRPWASHSSIRHSDIVLFSFQFLEIPETADALEALFNDLGKHHGKDLLEFTQHRNITLVLTRDQVFQIDEFWVEKSTTTRMSSGLGPKQPEELVRVSIFFRTYCQQETWQLVRELYCIVWTAEATKLWRKLIGIDPFVRTHEANQPLIQQSDLIQSIQQLHSFYGKRSVAYALHNIQLVLSTSSGFQQDEGRLQWRSPADISLPETTLKQLSVLLNSASGAETFAKPQYFQSSKLLQIIGGEHANEGPDFLPIAEDVGGGGAVLAMSPNYWPPQCPRFCLFVLLDQNFDNEILLGQLLRNCLRARDIYCVSEMTEDDKSVLRNWAASFRQ
jgi:hypothetical protein